MPDPKPTGRPSVLPPDYGDFSLTLSPTERRWLDFMEYANNQARLHCALYGHRWIEHISGRTRCRFCGIQCPDNPNSEASHA